MKLQIMKVESGGDHTREVVWLKALQACSLGDHILADTTFDEDGTSNRVRHTFWFPDVMVKKDDRVVVFTKTGKPKTGRTKADQPLHFLYWNLDEAVWNNEGDQAVLIEIADSTSFLVSAAK